MWFQKILIPTLRRVNGNSKGVGGGSQKPTFLKVSVKQMWTFQRGGGGGSNQKTLCGRDMDIIWNNATSDDRMFLYRREGGVWEGQRMFPIVKYILINK